MVDGTKDSPIQNVLHDDELFMTIFNLNKFCLNSLSLLPADKNSFGK